MNKPTTRAVSGALYVDTPSHPPRGFTCNDPKWAEQCVKGAIDDAYEAGKQDALPKPDPAEGPYKAEPVPGGGWWVKGDYGRVSTLADAKIEAMRMNDAWRRGREQGKADFTPTYFVHYPGPCVVKPRGMWENWQGNFCGERIPDPFPSPAAEKKIRSIVKDEIARDKAKSSPSPHPAGEPYKWSYNKGVVDWNGSVVARDGAWLSLSETAANYNRAYQAGWDARGGK